MGTRKRIKAKKVEFVATSTKIIVVKKRIPQNVKKEQDSVEDEPHPVSEMMVEMEECIVPGRCVGLRKMPVEMLEKQEKIAKRDFDPVNAVKRALAKKQSKNN